ncbi:MAG TPA: hexapeptide transferase [Lentisphaeria bacterium]|nr:MAG: hexapeptide transferase [Lentisphaerae bacterium GWF2_50_93]HCE45635.1 hexapeptide transferase [Lentisphaeria bacterium]
MKKSIIVIGGGGHAKVLIGVLKKLKNFRIVGYTDIKDKGEILGIKHLGDDSVLSKLAVKNRTACAALGIGKTEKPDCRKSMIANLKKLGFRLPAIISPDAVVNEDVILGDATVVFDGVVVNSGSRIGCAVILNTNSTIEHDCTIGAFTHIAPGATLSGGVEIGENSFIGAGSTIIHGTKVTSNCIVGAGSVVIRNFIKPGTFVGNPARKIR